MLYQFHANLYVHPPNATAGEPVTLRNLQLATVRPASFTAYYDVTFDHTLSALIKLPRLDAEPDGFFVIAGELDGRRWQVDGHLYDFNDRLHRVELHGQCPPDAFDAILACLGWPATPLAFELVREGVALDEAAFRSWAKH